MSIKDLEEICKRALGEKAKDLYPLFLKDRGRIDAVLKNGGMRIVWAEKDDKESDFGKGSVWCPYVRVEGMEGGSPGNSKETEKVNSYLKPLGWVMDVYSSSTDDGRFGVEGALFKA